MARSLIRAQVASHLFCGDATGGRRAARYDFARRTQQGQTLGIAGARIEGGTSERDAGRLLSPAELRGWRAFLQAHAFVTRRLEGELEKSTGLSLAFYDVLVQLAVADGRRLRMKELADHVMLSRSGLTRLVDRMERAGLVSRNTCAADGRGTFAVMTEAGYRRLRDATPAHLDGVRRNFIEPLTSGELAGLAQLLEGVADLAR
jgi:DNA-binding MarR family transcriptional regulator